MSGRAFDPRRFEFVTLAEDDDTHDMLAIVCPLDRDTWREHLPHLPEQAIRTLRLNAAGLLARIACELDAALGVTRDDKHRCHLAGADGNGFDTPCGAWTSRAITHPNDDLDERIEISLYVPPGQTSLWRARTVALLEQVRREDAQTWSAAAATTSTPAEPGSHRAPADHVVGGGAAVLPLNRRRPA